MNSMVSFAFPLEGILASQIPSSSGLQRAFSSQAGLRGRWSELANGLPSKVREVERKQYGISFFLLSNQRCIPKVNRKWLGPKLFSWEPFHFTDLVHSTSMDCQSLSRGRLKGETVDFLERLCKCSQANRKVPGVLDGAFPPHVQSLGPCVWGKKPRPKPTEYLSQRLQHLRPASCFPSPDLVIACTLFACE